MEIVRNVMNLVLILRKTALTIFCTFKEEIFGDKKHKSYCIYYPRQSVAK